MPKQGWFGLVPVRSPLLRESLIVFFSSGYLDVSVLRVSFLSDSPKTGFPHSEIAGSKLVCQLPRAYRRLQRPSSPLIAKASTVCTSVLDHTILELTKRPFMHGTDYTINADL